MDMMPKIVANELENGEEGDLPADGEDEDAGQQETAQQGQTVKESTFFSRSWSLFVVHIWMPGDKLLGQLYSAKAAAVIVMI